VVHQQQDDLLVDVESVLHGGRVNGLVILAPPGTTGDPDHFDVGTGGRPEALEPLTAQATWPRAVSVSWRRIRPHDWSYVLDAIEDLGAPPFHYEGVRTETVRLEGAGRAYLTRRVLPHLGVTLLVYEGSLDQTVVVVVAGELDELPTSVRLLPVPDDRVHAPTDKRDIDGMNY
jgi:hypothetical protein